MTRPSPIPLIVCLLVFGIIGGIFMFSQVPYIIQHWDWNTSWLGVLILILFLAAIGIHTFWPGDRDKSGPNQNLIRF